MRSATMGKKQSDTRYSRLVQSPELKRYAQTFVENEIDDRWLPTLTADNLRNLGVILIGHRRLLLDSDSFAARQAAGGDRAAYDARTPRAPSS